MRVIVILILFLQVSVVFAQTDKTRVLSLELALENALENNPVAITDSARKICSFAVKTNWYLWLYQIQKCQIINEYVALLEDFDRIIDLRYESGDISLSEKSIFTNQVAEIRLSQAIAANELDITLNQLQQLLFTNEEIVPADTALSLYMIHKTASLPEDFTAPADTSHSEYELFIKNKTIEKKQFELDGLFLRLHYYNTIGLLHAETLLLTTQAQFKSEEIDYLEFIRIIAEVYKIKADYLDTLNRYNQCAINLESYAY